MTRKVLTEAEIEEKRQNLLAKKREYNRLHADRINQMNRENHKKDIEYNLKNISCECGAYTSRHHKSEHVKTQRHLSLMIERNASSIINAN